MDRRRSPLHIRTAIFDLDGTLVNLPIDYNKLRNFLNIDDKTSIYQTAMSLPDVKKKTFLAYWNAIEDESIPNATLIKAGENIYHYLVIRFDPWMGLVTRNSEATAKKIVEKFGFEFNAIIGRETAFDRMEQLMEIIKGRPQPVALEETVFVGNTLDDYKAAKNVHMYFLGV